MSSVLDYVGRKYDVLAFRGAKATGDVQLSQTLFDGASSGELCTGIQKLSQRFAIELLTEDGSMTFRPLRGCQFMRDVRLGRLRTELQVQTSFDFSLLDIRRNLVNEEPTDMADDERFENAELTSIAILPGFLRITVTITSVAGTSRQVILPISTTV